VVTEASAARDRLIAARDSTASQIDALQRDFDGIVAAADSANIDDEHDPEGATIAFERQQVAALLRDARVHLDEIDAALERLDRDRYGACASAARGSLRRDWRRCRRPCSAARARRSAHPGDPRQAGEVSCAASSCGVADGR